MFQLSIDYKDPYIITILSLSYFHSDCVILPENKDIITSDLLRIQSDFVLEPQVDRLNQASLPATPRQGLKSVRKKRILKPCLMQESHSTKVLHLFQNILQLPE